MSQENKEVRITRMLKVSKRKIFRNDLLIELYDHYFDSSGTAFSTAKKDLDFDAVLAYDYLKDKGYIAVEAAGVDFLVIKITVSGIDIVEQL